MDVFDGHNVAELLFGPDLVAAPRRFTAARIEVRLNVSDPEHWIERFAAAGADIITVQSGPCADVAGVLGRIRDLGCEAGLGIELPRRSGGRWRSLFRSGPAGRPSCG